MISTVLDSNSYWLWQFGCLDSIAVLLNYSGFSELNGFGVSVVLLTF